MALPHLAFLMASPLLILLAAATATASASNAATTSSGDLSGLLTFKAQVFDPTGVLHDNWTSTTPYCAWAGITCGHRHRLRVLTTEKGSGGRTEELGQDQKNWWRNEE
ncbi:unnamed protein product [Urochloa humidicola]